MTTFFTPAQILSAFQYRKSCRHYDPSRKISAEDFNYILELARLSPSSVGSEPWQFLVVQNPELRQKLKPFAWGMAATLDTASHIVVILAKKNARYDSPFMLDGIRRRGITDPEAIGNGDKKAIEGLMEGNLMSGLAMQAGQSSRSASGAGHQFSHTWEMEGHGLDWEPPLSHGFKVGIGTIASCAIWEEFLAMEAEDFDVDRALAAVKTPEQVESEVRAALKPRMQDEAVRHSLKKRTEGEELVARIELLKEKWPELRERLRAQLMAPGEVMDRLKTVGAPYHPELIEIDWDRFRQTHFKAQMIRDRYTVLDILVDLGVYGDVVERLFSPEGFWGRHRHPSA